MPYLTTEQLFTLSNVLGFCFLGISLMMLLSMKTKRYGRKLAKKCVRKYDVNFNREFSLALTGGSTVNHAVDDERKKFRERRKAAGEKRLQTAYDTAKRLAEQGLNVAGIEEKVNLPRNEIELIVKFRRMNMAITSRDERSQYGDYGNSRLEALRHASEKIARLGAVG